MLAKVFGVLKPLSSMILLKPSASLKVIFPHNNMLKSGTTYLRNF